MTKVVRSIRRELKSAYPGQSIKVETIDDHYGLTVKIFVGEELKHNFIIDYREYIMADSPQDFLIETIREQIREGEDKIPNGG